MGIIPARAEEESMSITFGILIVLIVLGIGMDDGGNSDGGMMP